MIFSIVLPFYIYIKSLNLIKKYQCIRSIASQGYQHRSYTLIQTHHFSRLHISIQYIRFPRNKPINNTIYTIIYNAAVTTNDANETQEYIGSTETEFELRYANHKTSFNNPLRKNATALSQYIWKMKSEDKPVNVK